MTQYLAALIAAYTSGFAIASILWCFIWPNILTERQTRKQIALTYFNTAPCDHGFSDRDNCPDCCSD